MLSPLGRSSSRLLLRLSGGRSFPFSILSSRANASDSRFLANVRNHTASSRAFASLRAALLELLILLFSFCQAHTENIKIGLPSVTITAMPFFVAREHGFFQQEG